MLGWITNTNRGELEVSNTERKNDCPAERGLYCDMDQQRG
ncbi:hypothetical protein CHC_T00010178001 [Chondrus crispus]|uniref:Uncharacterized protein n=1 Tax=Chondrus crispus TaxID=2769 RepID=R7QQB0_CHOCR|nr:hypothetical protein CHC_T00010178001 [Chondrus crispus]CDF40309.1 hypothetical protein CHC_T00010178001 [Chondrus crispus]|eukprot:XP_005710603.1 hypothetical protein CHC_T00010178001 [Chondrus crispus]